MREEWASSTEEFRGRGALVVAVPGQELHVWSWLTAFDPLVFVLADGPGRAATVRNLIRAEACVGSVFCRATPEGIERSLVDRDCPRLLAIARELSEEFVRYGIEYVVVGQSGGQGGGGRSAVDRVCRLLVDAATGIAARTLPGIRYWEATDDAAAAGVTLPADGDPWGHKRRAIRKHSHWPAPLHDSVRDDGLDGSRIERFAPARPFVPAARGDGSVLRPPRAGVADIEGALDRLSEALRHAVAGASPAKVAA